MASEKATSAGGVGVGCASAGVPGAGANAKDGSGRSMVQIAPDEDIREFVLGTIEDLIVETGRTSVAMVATDAAISATEVKP